MAINYELGRSNWRTFRDGIEKEWLITNGIGGYANQSVIGANHRMFCGYLHASFHPPADRFTLLAGTHEAVVIGGVTYDLAAQEYIGMFREGQQYLNRFEFNGVPTFTYQVNDVLIKKTVALDYGKNTVTVCYELFNGKRASEFNITPLFTCKPLGATLEKSELTFDVIVSEDELNLKPKNQPEIEIYFKTSDGTFIDRSLRPTSMATPNYVIEENQVYHIDNRNGFLGVDHHFTPYDVRVQLKPGETKRMFIKCSAGPIDGKSGFEIVLESLMRQQQIIKKSELQDPLAQKLVASADAFIVDRESTGLKTVLAGYPWFMDWGRDTMIALQGLTLCTKRFDDARQILESFAKYVRHGLLPNNFPDRADDIPGYNTIDASLWYFYSVDRYLAYSGEAADYEFIQQKIYPALKEICHAYRDGTDYNIRMAEDGLVRGGSNLDQLTWMDVRVGDWVVTPRHGKPVEINALWFNALCVMGQLSNRFDDGSGDSYLELAERVKESFRLQFWNEAAECLYDVIYEDEQGRIVKDSRIRPNQIWAVFLPNTMLVADQERKIVETVYEQLYTPYGMRSLSPREINYKSSYIGKLIARDGAYHMGTSWGFISGAFISAYCKVYGHSEDAVRRAKEMCLYFEDHLADGCLNGIAEIFDGDFACTSRGCYTQAWSVSEVLRAYVEDVLPYLKSEG